MTFKTGLWFLIFFMSVNIASSQRLESLERDSSYLLNFASVGAVNAFSFENTTEAEFMLSVTYLGNAFSLVADWYDANGVLISSITFDANSVSSILSLPMGDLTLLISNTDGTGRATLVLSEAENGTLEMDVLSLPESGIWLASLIDWETNCSDLLTLEDSWLPEDGSRHDLAFSTFETLALDVHRVVAPQEIEETPEFFSSFVLESPLEFEVVPNIQTAPYAYFYRVLSQANIILLEYTQTLALSDCVLTASYEITRLGDDDSFDDVSQTTGLSLIGWRGFINEMMDSPIVEGSDNPEDALCITGGFRGQMWSIEASEAFIELLENAYGQTLSFNLSTGVTGLVDPYILEIVIGNGIVLHYDLSPAPDDGRLYRIDIVESTGWFDPDGFMPTDDADLFSQMVSDVTALRIMGYYGAPANIVCLQNVNLE